MIGCPIARPPPRTGACGSCAIVACDIGSIGCTPSAVGASRRRPADGLGCGRHRRLLGDLRRQVREVGEPARASRRPPACAARSAARAAARAHRSPCPRAPASCPAPASSSARASSPRCSSARAARADCARCASARRAALVVVVHLFLGLGASRSPTSDSSDASLGRTSSMSTLVSDSSTLLPLEVDRLASPSRPPRPSPMSIEIGAALDQLAHALAVLLDLLLEVLVEEPRRSRRAPSPCRGGAGSRCIASPNASAVG